MNKGFTLIELLVVVLILGILASMAIPQYFKAVERSRMSEAETLLNTIAQAQRRKFLQKNQFIRKYEGLDVHPKGATGSVYYTKGTNGNGFKIELSQYSYERGIAIATRVDNGSKTGNLQYQYSLSRYYQSNDVTCTGDNLAGQKLCADFCGVDHVSRYCCNNGTSGKDCEAPVSNQN